MRTLSVQTCANDGIQFASILLIGFYDNEDLVTFFSHNKCLCENFNLLHPAWIVFWQHHHCIRIWVEISVRKAKFDDRIIYIGISIILVFNHLNYYQWEENYIFYLKLQHLHKSKNLVSLMKKQKWSVISWYSLRNFQILLSSTCPSINEFVGLCWGHVHVHAVPNYHALKQSYSLCRNSSHVT